MSEASDGMFNSMYQKFGANFFLACFVAALSAVIFLYFEGKSCNENTLLLEQKHTLEQSKTKDEIIDYLKNIEKKTEQVETEAEAVEAQAVSASAQIKKIKKDLK